MGWWCLRRPSVSSRMRLMYGLQWIPFSWFLHDKEQFRSSYYLEDVATEFHVQGARTGLGLRRMGRGLSVWGKGLDQHFSFVDNRWIHLHKKDRQTYLKNAYRVLLTRARQGMVVVVPEGDVADPTRSSAYCDPTFEYFQSIGFTVI